MNERFKNLLIKHEGLELKPYKDNVGKTTIGVGRCLDDAGLSKDEVMYLLDNDIIKCMSVAAKYQWFKDLDEVRQAVVLSMIFNLGSEGFKKFAKTIAYISVRMYKEAADEMMRSQWARQVGKRAVELSFMMNTGSWDK